jgi:hypothetical protein
MVSGNEHHHPWTDDELRSIVAGSKSWRDVLRAFGYSPTSGHAKERLRSRVLDLGLSTEHFTGQRKWTDAQLIHAVEKSRSCRNCCAIYG